MSGKTDRNLEIYNLRKSNPKAWSFRKLGERYNITDTRVRQIIAYIEKGKNDR